MEDKVQQLKKIIQKHAIVTSSTQKIVSSPGEFSQWVFDFRNIFFDSYNLNLITDILWSVLEHEYPFQVAGQELAAVPLVSALIVKSQLMGKPVSGFIIRKSRKKTGLQRIIEGKITDQKIILIDDLINSGTTIRRQAGVIENLGKKIDLVVTIVNFRNGQNVEKLRSRGIRLKSLFSLEDFGMKMESKKELISPYKIVWELKSPGPSYSHVVAKSTPAIDDDKLYFGSDSGYFWALNQSDGSVAWKFKVGHTVQEKSTFFFPGNLQRFNFLRCLRRQCLCVG